LHHFKSPFRPGVELHIEVEDIAEGKQAVVDKGSVEELVRSFEVHSLGSGRVEDILDLCNPEEHTLDLDSRGRSSAREERLHYNFDAQLLRPLLCRRRK